jgi:predicted DNA-binding transcriptional regulator YafY
MSTKLERLIAIDALIRAKRYPNARTIAERFEVSERTAYDDLSFLKDRMNAPVEYDSARGGWYYTEPNWGLPTFMATEGELLAFLLSMELAGRYLGRSYEDILDRALTSLAQSLPNRVQLDLNELAAQYSFTAGATVAVNPRLLQDLNIAIRDRRPVRVTYYTASRDARSERILQPYALRNVRGDWHVVAHDSLRNEVRIFALTRIEQWQILHHQQFDRPDDFSLDDYMGSAFLSERGGSPELIMIQFDEYQSRYIRERRWHATQEPLEEMPDGGVVLRFYSGALEEIKRWVLGFGSHATIIAPPALRTAVAEEAIALAEKYQVE